MGEFQKLNRQVIVKFVLLHDSSTHLNGFELREIIKITLQVQ